MTNAVKFNVVEVLVKLGYSDNGVRSQKTTLLKQVMNTELTSEVKDIEEISKEDMIKMLSIIMTRKSGKSELRESAKQMLIELGAEIEEIVSTEKAKGRKKPNCEDLAHLIKALQKEIDDLKEKVAKLEK